MLFDLGPGTYSVVVTDVNGCEASESGTIEVLELFEANFLMDDEQAIEVLLTEPGTDATFSLLRCLPDDSMLLVEEIIDDFSAYFFIQESGKYAVSVQQGDCESTTECVSFVFSSTHQASSSELFPELRLHPNPTNGSVYFSLDQETRVELFDATGIWLWEGNFPAGQQEMDASNLPGGVYFLHFQRPEGRQTLRFIRQ